MFTQINALKSKTFLPAAAALLFAFAIAPNALAAGPVLNPSPLAAFGAPAINPSDGDAMLGFATAIGGTERHDLNMECQEVIAFPGSYDANTLAYCDSLSVAESLAPHTSRDQQ